jgi:nucleoside-diphosphate-sugar epimerase
MNNILITGNSGFLAKEFKNHFSKKNNVFKIDRTSLLSLSTLIDILTFNKIDFIIHTSWAGVGSGTKEDYEYNFKVQANLESVSNYVKKIFTFGSGAEFADTDNVKEYQLPNLQSGTYYALAKNKIAHRIRYLDNFVNLRLFGCFGKEENDHRFIKKSMFNIKNEKNIIINKDKQMDFFYVGDLITLIETYTFNLNKIFPKELNCVYSEKIKLSDIAKFLVEKYSLNTQIKIIEEGYDKPYTGSSLLLDSLKINLKGLYRGIEEIYGH